MDTVGLWSFSTCTVHGGFSDGDFLFSGSTITTVTNWQDMQVNDPARDLAWDFSASLDESHRNAVLSAYGRMMGSRLDDPHHAQGQPVAADGTGGRIHSGS